MHRVTCFSSHINSLTNLKLICFTKTARHVQFAIRDFYDKSSVLQEPSSLSHLGIKLINKSFLSPSASLSCSFTHAIIKVSSTTNIVRRISYERYSRLLITWWIEYSTRISCSTNTEYIGDGRCIRARGSALSRLNTPADPRVCERDQTCFCSSGLCTVRVLLVCSSRWEGEMARREEERNRGRQKERVREKGGKRSLN